MTVTVDTAAGFCWGVVRTIAIAEETLKGNEELRSLGDIIHNPVEIERMRELGLSTIRHEDLGALEKGTKVLIRAHGEPPETYRRARELGIELIDATCPVVTKLQERIGKFYDQGYQVVIFGKKEHAEVIGLRGVTNDECIVVKSAEEALAKVDFTRKTVLFAQTTMDKPTFHRIRAALEEKIAGLVVDSMESIAVEFHAKETICGQVSGREKKLAAFARSNDVVIFAAGRKSSNGKVLFDVCREANPRTHFIETEEELEESWFDGAATVGVTGATSTPQWLMERVKGHIERNFGGWEKRRNGSRAAPANEKDRTDNTEHHNA